MSKTYYHIYMVAERTSGGVATHVGLGSAHTQRASNGDDGGANEGVGGEDGAVREARE